MSKLKVNVRSYKVNNTEIQIVDLGGFLDAHTVPQLENTLNSLFKIGQYKIILNMLELQYISSAGLGLLVGVIDEIKNNKGNIFVVNLAPNVYRVFDILGFTKIFQIFCGETEALEKFKEVENINP